MRLHAVIDDVVDARFLRAQKFFRIAAFGRLHVVVQVAVAQVAEVDQAHAGDFGLQQGVGGFDEGGDARDGAR